jgi:DNA (cytosine-5)-methyltransferase 1
LRGDETEVRDVVADLNEPRAYYNEIEPFGAQMLRNLIAAGHIAPGDIDERDIRDIRPVDLRGYSQLHLFAGAGLWSHAFRLVGWPDDRPAITLSCPCQPFSAAGEGDGFADERHLWPAAFHLIRGCRELGLACADRIFGEQVERALGFGWLDLVQTDLEGEGYAFGTATLNSASVGAPNQRHRIYFVGSLADIARIGRRQRCAYAGRSGTGEFSASRARLEHRSDFGCMARTDGDRRAADAGPELHDASHHAESRSIVGDTIGDGLEGCAAVDVRRTWGHDEGREAGRASGTSGFWSDADWIFCRDGKWRPVEPGTFPLAHGSAARVGRLRAYGNAINPEVAAEFIRAYIECRVSA